MWTEIFKAAKVVSLLPIERRRNDRERFRGELVRSLCIINTSYVVTLFVSPTESSSCGVKLAKSSFEIDPGGGGCGIRESSSRISRFVAVREI